MWFTKKLHRFYCAGRDIKYLHEENLTDMSSIVYSQYVELKLGKNLIETVNNKQFVTFKHIMSVDLSGNKLKVIDKNVFEFNEKLEHIDLSNNSISSFNLNLNNLKSLTQLLLHVNMITTLTEEVFHYYFSNKNILNIRSNLISCTCMMSWIRLLENINTTILTSSTDICKFPLHDNVSVACFIYKDTCDINIESKKCIPGNLLL